MTHYYLYIRAGKVLDANTRFYKVGIGESQSQLRKLAWLESYALENGHFFVRWSQDAVSFMLQCQKSIGPGCSNILAVCAAELVRILRDGHAEPSSVQANINRHRLMMQIDSAYYCFNTIRNKRKEVPSECTSDDTR